MLFVAIACTQGQPLRGDSRLTVPRRKHGLHLVGRLKGFALRAGLKQQFRDLHKVALVWAVQRPVTAPAEWGAAVMRLAMRDELPRQIGRAHV